MIHDIYISNEHGDVKPLSCIDVNRRYGGLVAKQDGVSKACLFLMRGGDFLTLTADSALGGIPMFELQDKPIDMATLPKNRKCFPSFKLGKCILDVRRSLNDTKFYDVDLSKQLFSLWVFRRKFSITDAELLSIRQLCFKYGYNVKLVGDHIVRLSRSMRKVQRIKSMRILGSEMYTLDMIAYMDNIQFQGVKL